VKYYWKLVRPINLLLTVLTQLLFILSASRINHSFLHFDWSNIRFQESITTMLACVFVAAGGYVINDIFDIETDHINRPEKLILSKHISPKSAKIFYVILTSLGIISGFLTGIGMGILCLVLAILLYFYSSDLKGEMLQGNLLISLMAGMVVYVASRGVFNVQNTYFAEYASVAFLITMARELIKDIEDLEGDKAQEHETYPIMKGIRATKILAAIFMFFTLLIAVLLIFQSNAILFKIFITGLIIAPIFYYLYLLYNAKEKGQFRNISNWLKLTMFIGLFSSLFC
jgi:4-hydroxybenzoate polyprenyltransferase